MVATTSFQLPPICRRFNGSPLEAQPTRRSFLGGAVLSAPLAFVLPLPNRAVARSTLTTAESAEQSLYLILRAQEATLQELRLIKKGLYKDVQRANIKLAVKFILKNYNLLDNFLNVSQNIVPESKQIEANGIAQEIVSDLTTILEYFDSQDVQNLKVGGVGALASATEPFVIEGLVSANKKIQLYIDLCPTDSVERVMATISYENELNMKEFPEDVLGKLKNPDPRIE